MDQFSTLKNSQVRDFRPISCGEERGERSKGFDRLLKYKFTQDGGETGKGSSTWVTNKTVLFIQMSNFITFTSTDITQKLS